MELAAGVVVIRPVAEGCRFLLLRAFRYWDFPKGLVEPGEVPLNAAVREVAEETGIADLSFPWDRDRYETETYNRGRKKAVYFAGRTAQTEVVLPVSAELGCPEHHEYRWVTAAEGRELLGDRVRGALEWARRYAGCPEG
ncbi:hypothetical protein AN478_08975 [Thiohalorhabdus denitrificans]|nr:hypothetical protein AN478_08975 [Thiohalorhabdus denitrificans]